MEQDWNRKWNSEVIDLVQFETNNKKSFALLFNQFLSSVNQFNISSRVPLLFKYVILVKHIYAAWFPCSGTNWM